MTKSAIEFNHKNKGNLSERRRKAQLPALLASLLLIGIAGWMIRSQLMNYQVTSAKNSASKISPPFDFSRLELPRKEILSGGPPKDGIPALDEPLFNEASEADYLLPTDRVIGVAFEGKVKAYPLKILDYHEVVNDFIDDRPIMVTYCPLCDSSVVFDRRLAGKIKSFGVSGLLYQSNVLLFDRATNENNKDSEGLWTQMGAVGVSGKGAQQPLHRLPMEVTSWQAWQERYPESLVLSNETGYDRSYNRTVYRSYFESDRLMFPVTRTDPRLPQKNPVLGVVVNQMARAYPIPTTGEPMTLEQSLGGNNFTIVTDPTNASIRVENADEGTEWCYAYWFAWQAFHEQTDLFVGHDLTEDPSTVKTSTIKTSTAELAMEEKEATKEEDFNRLSKN